MTMGVMFLPRVADVRDAFARLRDDFVAIQRLVLRIPEVNKFHLRLLNDLCERTTECEVVLVSAMREEA